MDFADLTVFKAVADAGGVTAAARRLHRVQSGLTARIRQLEASLGTELFIREGRRMVLSPAGQRFRTYADEMLALAERARAAAGTAVPAGTLRLGTLESTAASRLPPLLGAFHRAFRDVRVELVTGTTDALVDAVRNRTLDAAFVADPPRDPRLCAHAAFRERLVLVTPRGHAPVRGAGDIALDTIIAFPAGCTYRRRLTRWLGAAAARVRVLELASYHAIVACVAAGTGVALVPSSVLSTLRNATAVRTHRLPASIAATRTALVHRASDRPAAVDALRNLL